MSYSMPPITYGNVAQELATFQHFPTQNLNRKPQKVPQAPKQAAAAPAAVTPKAAEPKAAPSVDHEALQSAAASAQSRKRTTGFAIVKEVTSGDSVVVVSSNGYPPQEKAITISGINAPKFARGRDKVDEPYAWASREYLRKRIIGQQVHFVVNYVHPTSGREYCQLTHNGVNLAQMMLKAGLAVVKPLNKDNKSSPERDELLAFQNEAERARLGVHSGDVSKASIRKITWDPDARQFFQHFKNIALPAVIDSVRDGSTLRCELLGPVQTLEHKMITLHLAGVQAPRVPLPKEFRQKQFQKKQEEEPEAKHEPPQDEETEPFALEAQLFTELRLLNRDCNVVLQGVDKFGNFFGTVQFAKGNISVKLLESGLAKLVPWSAAITPDGPKLAQAEAKAKQAHLRLWESYVPSESKEAQSGTEFTGKVVQVLSGDTVVIQDDKGNENRYLLASIRAPKMGNARREEEAKPMAFEAREFIRKNTIGKKVRVVTEYTRELRPNFGSDKKQQAEPVQTQQYVTLFVGKDNLSEQMVAKGLASVIKHRVEEPRSIYYEALQAAEATATDAKKGVHSDKLQSVHPVIDLTERFRSVGEDSKRKAKAGGNAKFFLEQLKRTGKVTGVVEHVFSATRVKVFIPSQNCMLAFILGGVKVSERKEAKAYADQALQFAKLNLLHHDIAIEAEDLDRGENFIGTLTINGQNFALQLLQKGLVEVFEFSARKGPHLDQYLSAQAEAKNGRKGIWKDYVETEEKGDDSGASGEQLSGKTLDVKISELVDAAKFYVHILSDPTLGEVETKMKEFSESADDTEALENPAKGTICAGKFTDGQWYRVRVESSKDGQAKVFFIDYGNSDSLPTEALRQLPEDLQKIPALAKPCILAGVKAPALNRDYGEDAAYAFNDLAFGKELVAKVEFQEFGGLLHVTLQEAKDSEVSINRKLLQEGWVRLVEKPKRNLEAYTAALKPDQTIAQKAHKNQWQYGNVSDGEEEEEKEQAPRGGKKGGKAKNAEAPAEEKKGGKPRKA